MTAGDVAPVKCGCWDGRTLLRRGGDLRYEVTHEYKRLTESGPSPRRFPAQVPRGKRRGGGGVYHRAAARAGRDGICGSEREDYRGLHWLRHRGAERTAGYTQAARGADCRRV